MVCGIDAWGTINAERRKLKYLRSLMGLSRMDGVRDKEVRRRAGIEREVASRVNQRVLRLLAQVERING